MPNKRKEGTKLYTVPVNKELAAVVEKVIESEQKRVGAGYTVTRADVLRKVLEENCHRYLTGEPKKKEGKEE